MRAALRARPRPGGRGCSTATAAWWDAASTTPSTAATAPGRCAPRSSPGRTASRRATRCIAVKPSWDDHGPAGEVTVRELAGRDARGARAALWRYLLGARPRAHAAAGGSRPTTTRSPHLLAQQRRGRPPRARRAVGAAASTSTPRWPRAPTRSRSTLVLELEDAFCPWNTGRYRLHATDGCERDRRAERRPRARRRGARRRLPRRRRR